MISYRGRLQACTADLTFVNDTRAWEAEQYNASLATARIAAYKNGADQGRRDCDIRVLRVMGNNQVPEGRLRDTTRERDGYKDQLKQSQMENARLVHVWQEDNLHLADEKRERRKVSRERDAGLVKLYHVENQKRKLEDQVEGDTKELVATHPRTARPGAAGSKGVLRGQARGVQGRERRPQAVVLRALVEPAALLLGARPGGTGRGRQHGRGGRRARPGGHAQAHGRHAWGPLEHAGAGAPR